MPRVSAAALAVPSPAPPPHPKPPPELTKRQAAIWRAIVACRPPTFFDGASGHLLVAYCRHAATADVIAAEVDRTDPSDLKHYRQLLMMAARESAALARLSAKLRLAPQHVRRIEQKLPGIVRTVPWLRHID
jgi:hypothetical protein